MNSSVICHWKHKNAFENYRPFPCLHFLPWIDACTTVGRQKRKCNFKTSKNSKVACCQWKMSDFKGKDYLPTLDDNSRDLYMKKLQLAYNCQLPNPYDLLGWKNEVTLLPDISWPDIYN